MYIGCRVELHMTKVIRVGEEFDVTRYECEVLEYNQEEEQFGLLLKNGALTSLSLDAKYECQIDTDEEKLSCFGRIKERYQNENGNVLLFQIENGFYAG
ncbi:MAG: hypothetical protein RR275_02935 [Lachnospiraceae bacterium]